MWKFSLADFATKLSAKIYNPKKDGRTGEPGLEVYTKERVRRNYFVKPLLNSEFGLDQAQDASFDGTPDGVHNGTDTVFWEGSNIVGSTVTFDSTARIISGAKSVEIAAPGLGDIWEFDKGSNLTVGNFKALTLKINIDKDWSVGDSVAIYGYDTGTGLEVGTRVFLEDFMNESEFDQVQSIAIPLTDMDLTSGTIDAIRMEQVAKQGKTATWYLDDFQVEEISGLLNYEYGPNRDQIFHVELIGHVVRNNTTADNTRDPDLYFGETALTNGILISVRRDGEESDITSSNNLGEFLELPNIQEFETIETANDSGKTMSKLTKEFPFELDGRTGDFFRYTITDNLSSLTYQSAWLFGWIEELGELRTVKGK